MGKTSLGLGENIEGALCYLLGWLTGIIFYILKKDNTFVRFHAKQSILTFLPLHILWFILGGGMFWGGIFFWGAWAFCGNWIAHRASYVHTVDYPHAEGISGRNV